MAVPTPPNGERGPRCGWTSRRSTRSRCTRTATPWTARSFARHSPPSVRSDGPQPPEDLLVKLRWSEEARASKERGAPVVALETSVVAQGLPYPHNLEAARACEEAVRRAGATPASIAVIDGEIYVGLPPNALRALAERRGEMLKVASRDLPIALAMRRTGGTTVSATCEIAWRAGIRVFATGGIGGVHRGFEQHLDVSQDLWALSRFPVAVVCAGAKSMLDLPKTLEVLEAVAVPVVGVGTDELPSFYSRSSGLRLEHWGEDAARAAAIARARFEALERSEEHTSELQSRETIS